LGLKEVTLSRYRVVEICAGAGGQSLGLELAGFEHELSVELDPNAAATLRHNRPHWKVAIGDVANPGVWEGAPRSLVEQSPTAHDPVYAVLRDDGGFLTMDQIRRRLPAPLEIPAFERHLAHLRRDFHIEVQPRRSGDAYKLGPFKAFTGQDDHLRHEAFPHSANIS
jgi:hypothetical protein